ncbi:MAG: sulfatase family protein [Paludibacteraceae bacterium]
MRYLLTNSILTFGACLAMPTQAQKDAKTISSEKPNVVLIYADDIGYGDFSCYGAHRVETPNVDMLANNGLRFRNAHAVAATSTPSRYGMFTGEYPWRRKGTGVARGDAGLIIKPHRYTVAKLMKEAGFTTAAVGKWHLGMGENTGTQDWNGRIAPGPYEIGFDYSYLMAATGDRVPCVYLENQKVANLDHSDPIYVNYVTNFSGEPTGKDNPELLTKLRPSHGHDQSIVNGISRIGYMKGGETALWKDETIADSITIHAVRFIERNKDKPFFLYFGTNDIHVPRYPNERFRGKTEMGHRGDAIAQFDWSVGEVIRALKEAGIFENTLIILSSDNGPVVDDGYQDEAVERLLDHKPWGPYRGGKYSMFEAGTRVPFIVHWQKVVRPGVSDALVSQIDLLGSMAALTGLNADEEKLCDSRNQLPAWLGLDDEGREYVVGAGSSLMIRTKEWKYIEPNKGSSYSKYTNTEMGNSPEDQLYHLLYDRGEYDNVAGENHLKVRFFKQILEDEKRKGVGMEL